MKKTDEKMDLVALGSKKTVYADTYNADILEAFDNQHAGNDYMVSLDCAEFTTLCPITGQPDFAKIVIRYIPDKRLVESKSLKLYLFSFRNHGGFHEDCVNVILRDLVKLLSPKYVEVKGQFVPRGGIAIVPFANYACEDEKYQRQKERRLFKKQ